MQQPVQQSVSRPCRSQCSGRRSSQRTVKGRHLGGKEVGSRVGPPRFGPRVEQSAKYGRERGGTCFPTALILTTECSERSWGPLHRALSVDGPCGDCALAAQRLHTDRAWSWRSRVRRAVGRLSSRRRPTDAQIDPSADRPQSAPRQAHSPCTVTVQLQPL